jgi:hypothetical protein
VVVVLAAAATTPAVKREIVIRAAVRMAQSVFLSARNSSPFQQRASTEPQIDARLYAGLSGNVNDGGVNEFARLQTFAVQAQAEGASQHAAECGFVDAARFRGIDSRESCFGRLSVVRRIREYWWDTE